MKNAPRIASKRSVFLLILLVATAITIGVVNHRTAEATNDDGSIRRFNVSKADAVPVELGARPSVWMKLAEGKPIGSELVGPANAISGFETGSFAPSAAIAVDIDNDGLADVLSGYGDENAGALTLHRANPDAFGARDESLGAAIRNGDYPVSFNKEVPVFELAFRPDFIVSGRFFGESATDVVVGSRASGTLSILSFDDRGQLRTTRQMTVDGNVTAIAADRFDQGKRFSGLAVATDTGDLFVYDGAKELNSSKPRAIAIGGTVDSMVLSAPDGSTFDRDLFVLADGRLARFKQIGSGFDRAPVDIPVRIADFAIGEFIRDRQAKAEIAVLGDDGSVYFVRNGQLDERPFTEKEMRAKFARDGRGRSVLTDANAPDGLGEDWTIAETRHLGVVPSARTNAQPLLRKAMITGNGIDDLLVTDPATNRVRVLFKEPNYNKNSVSFSSESLIQEIGFAAKPEAVVPVRLNVMGQQGIVALENGKFEPTSVMFVPNATFTVSKGADTNDGVCNADCSLREAIVAANGAAGSDLVAFAGAFTHQLTITGGDENSSATGDLDVSQALTITGNGSGNTILQAGTTTSNGIDKVLSINPTFVFPFATSISGVTVRFGRNQSSFSGDGFGGGFDWEGSGTGTLSVSNSIITDNRTTDGDGGGVTITNSSVGNGNTTFTGVTVSNNIPARVGGASPFGGALFVGTGTYFSVASSTISGNSVNGSGSNGQGGGIFAFSPSGSFGTSSISNTAISSNSAPSNGGGISSTQILSFTAPITFSSNSSGGLGGGLYLSTSGLTSISKAVFTGNSATTGGGGAYSAGGSLTIIYSRFASNTGGGATGLGVGGGSVVAENNWWACPTGPAAAPCNTAAASGGSLDFNPWLQLRISAASTTLVTGQTTGLTASFLQNSDGAAISTSNLDVLIGLGVTWGGSGATITGAQTTITPSGTATATFSASSVGSKTGTATVDSGTATVSITVNKADTTASITADTPDPSNVGQNVTVSYSVSVSAPGQGTPSGNVQVSDGVNSCTGTVGAGSCVVALSTAGNRTLTATYLGDSNFNASPASTGVSHTVGTVTWTGAANNVFTNNANWDTGLAPGSGDTVICPSSGVTNEPTISGAATVASFSVASGRVITLNNSLTVTGTLTNNGTIKGTGTIINNFSNAGTLAPGLSPGIFNITGTFANSGNFDVEIGGTGGAGVNPNGHDQLLVSGAATLGGTLNVTLTNGFTPTAGNSFVILDAASSTGTFATTNLPNILPNTWNLAYNNAAGTVTLTVVAPVAANASISGRVLASNGRPIANAVVIATDPFGTSRSVRTNSFGGYRIEELAVGEQYVLTVRARSYAFTPLVISPVEDVSGLDITADGSQ